VHVPGRPPFGRGRRAAAVLARVIDAAVWIGARLPTRVAHGLATVGGHLEWASRPGKRRRLAVNLAHAVAAQPRDRVVRRLVRREIVNEAHRSADLLWALGRPDDFLASLQLVGLEHVQQPAAERRGIVLVGIHVGGWELATAVPAAVLPMTATALVADDWLAWAIEGMRARVGLRVIARTAPVSRLGGLLRRGEAIIVLGDDGSGPPPRTHRVRFLDAEADLPSGAVTLARLYGAPLIGFSVLPLGHRRWRLVVDVPVEPVPPGPAGRAAADRETLQQLADRWSEIVRGSPQHWAASFPIRWRPGPR
jgi:lauroyl/myristoyl acyltransferase